jgi:hypothetical protein
MRFVHYAVGVHVYRFDATPVYHHLTPPSQLRSAGALGLARHLD